MIVRSFCKLAMISVYRTDSGKTATDSETAATMGKSFLPYDGITYTRYYIT
jgi:hypothetical protein